MARNPSRETPTYEPPETNEDRKQAIKAQIAELNGLIDSRIRMLKLSGSPIRPELLFPEARSVACAQLLVAAEIITADTLDLYFKRALMSMLDGVSRPDASPGMGGN